MSTRIDAVFVVNDGYRFIETVRCDESGLPPKLWRVETREGTDDVLVCEFELTSLLSYAGSMLPEYVERSRRIEHSL